MRRAIVSPSAATRLAIVREALLTAPPGAATLLVAHTRAAADECAAAVAAERGGLFAVTRSGLLELVMRLALPLLARERLSPTGGIGHEAVVTRARFEAMRDGSLTYFAPVADMPGFPRAASRTLDELQMAGVAPETLRRMDPAGADLADLLARTAEESLQAGASGRARMWEAATAQVTEASTDVPPALVLVDVPIATAVEERFVAALLSRVSSVVVTVPSGDRRTVDALSRLGVDATTARPPGAMPRASSLAGARSALTRLQEHVFSADVPPDGTLDESVTLFSAPGEGREAVEIARRILAEADRGVAFDDMAVVLRAPHTYLSLLEHALSRAGVPAWFERGTRRPDAAGRAFLALLACAEEHLSARRFAEYLSLGQVPSAPDETNAAAEARPMAGDGGTIRTSRTASHSAAPPGPPVVESAVGPPQQLPLWTAPADEVSSALVREEDRAEDPSPEDEAPLPSERDGTRVVAGTLRAPWRWEELLVEAYVIQGLDRWKRRLAGLAHEYALRLRELADEDQDSPRIAAIERDMEELAHLESFALPIVEVLDGWRDARTWGEWLTAFEALAPRVLRQPARVLRVLAEMAPLGAIGPISLREVREVLTPRLLTLTYEPSRRRHGRVFVGSPAAVRGRSFRVVFVPGLAERVFPQRLREDALLLDRRRRLVDERLATMDARADEERLQLRLAVGAAAERVYLSYPRIEVGESRPRVPSFYVLDVMRAVTGSIPRYADLAEGAAREGGASLAWPAPADPARAVDVFEHDLAVLLPLVREGSRKKVEGRARYLIQLNDALRRSVTERWGRWQPKWHTSDGLIRVTPETQAALDAQRLTARAYSLTALQRFASCPYQFQLAAIYRLAPLEDPGPLQRLDPLTRGSLFHAVQTECLRRLQQNGQLPVDAARLPAARGVLSWAMASVIGEAKDKLAPAIERVWNDEVDAMSRDLQRWLEKLADDGRTWTPEHFELAFGLPPDDQRDPASTPSPAVVGDGFLLRGSIDLVERKPGTRIVRITDHKTGKNRTNLATIVDGGRLLQPVLYGLALESVTGDTVEEGRLSYCTTAGNFSTHPIPLDVLTRRRGIEVLEIIDRAIERGTLAARPSRDACRWCDFTDVCGRSEERRTALKPARLFADLDELRKMP